MQIGMLNQESGWMRLRRFTLRNSNSITSSALVFSSSVYIDSYSLFSCTTTDYVSFSLGSILASGLLGDSLITKDDSALFFLVFSFGDEYFLEA
jgi:hypothetical protein